MKARVKPTTLFFCGEPRKWGTGLGMISLIPAENETQALFAYIEERAAGFNPLKDGEEVVLFPASTSTTYTVIDDEPKEEAADDAETDEEAVKAAPFA